MKIIALLLLLVLLLVQGAYATEQLFQIIPAAISDVAPRKAALGKQLFTDPILSGDNSIACSTCHILENYGVDNLKISVGVNGQKGKRNTPSVWNARYNFVQRWDGRNKTLHEQALSVIENSVEMDGKIENITRKLRQNKHYQQSFNKLYSDGVTEHNIGDAIEQFLKTLVTPDSKFDQYLQGDLDALNQMEVEGFKLFQSKGCVACHNGINIGGNLYQKLGVFDDSKAIEMGDYGRYLVTNNPVDKYYFKVPSLRNIEKTAPYLHDGSVKTLSEVVKLMGELQLGRQLSDIEVDNMVAFLKTLTGKMAISAISN